MVQDVADVQSLRDPPSPAAAPNLRHPQGLVRLPSVIKNSSRKSASSTSRNSRVNFALEVKEETVVPYSEIYGVHPRQFEFSADGMVAAELARRGTFAFFALVRMTWPFLLSPFLFSSLYGYEMTLAANIRGEDDIDEAGLQAGGLDGSLPLLVRILVIRPLGGLLIGHIADTRGRRISIKLSLSGMMVAAVGQGLLPFRHGDLARVFFFLQSLHIFCLAGCVVTVNCYVFEMAEPRTMGLAITLFGSALEIANLLGLCLGYLLQWILGQELMRDWGWRLPYLLCIIPGCTALWGLQRTSESVTYQAEATPHQLGQGFRELWAKYRLAILVGFLSTCCAATNREAATLKVWTRYTNGHYEVLLTSITRLVGLLVVPCVGLLMDIKGIAWVSFVGSCICAVAAAPAFAWVTLSDGRIDVVIICTSLVIGIGTRFAGAASMLVCAELFPTNLRASGMALTNNLGFSIFAGIAMVMHRDVLKGTPYGSGLYMSVAATGSVITFIRAAQLGRDGYLQLTHRPRRAKPYFGSMEVVPRTPEIPSAGSSTVELPAKPRKSRKLGAAPLTQYQDV